MSFISTVGAAVGAAGSLFGIVKGIGQQHAANKIHPTYTPYTASPYASDQLGIAEQMFNGRMAGASNQERNIANSQSNFNNSVDRNATNGSQALALAAAGQGEANNAYNNLNTEESQNKNNLLQNLNAAYSANINEGDKVFNAQNQKYLEDTNQKAQLAGAGASSIQNGIFGVGAMIPQMSGLLGAGKGATAPAGNSFSGGGFNLGGSNSFGLS